MANAILVSIADELGAATAHATDAHGAEAESITHDLFETAFRANGPDYWR